MKVAESRTMLEASRVNLIIATLLGIALGTSAYGETYPHRPVRLIVPFAAGGLNDVVARLIALSGEIAGPAVHRRQSAGRKRDRRNGCHGKGDTGRTHVTDGRLEFRRCPGDPPEAALRCGARPRADWNGCEEFAVACGQSKGAGQLARAIRGSRQGQSWPAQLRL